MVDFTGNAPSISQHSDGYEVWTFSDGDECVADLTDGETVRDLLVDLTADCAFMFRAQQKADWTIKNVGFDGMGHVYTDLSIRFLFQVSVPSGSTGRIENIYAYGKDDAPGTINPNHSDGTRLGCLYARGAHAGTLDVRNTYIEGFGNNAAYLSDPGKEGGNGGVVTIKDCAHRDNTVSQFRLGTDQSRVDNCVGLVHDPNGKRGSYPHDPGNHNARGMWARGGCDVTINDSTIYVDPDDINTDGCYEADHGVTDPQCSYLNLAVKSSHHNSDAPVVYSADNGATIDPRDSDTDPTMDVMIEGAPTSATMAAKGNREIPNWSEVPGPSTEAIERSVALASNDALATTAVSGGNAQSWSPTTDSGGVSISMVDSYEDQDLSEYSSGFGQLSDFSFASSPTPSDGSVMLELATSSKSANLALSTAGLSNYIPIGSTFRHYFEFESTTDCEFWTAFALADESTNDDYCRVEVEVQNDLVKLVKRTGGTNTELDSQSFSNWTTNQRYFLEVTWDDGSLGGSDGDVTVNFHEVGNSTPLWTLQKSGDADLQSTGSLGSNTGVGVELTTSNSNSVYADYHHVRN